MGVIISTSGVFGLVLGSGLSYHLRLTFKFADPLICGLGLVTASPFLFVANKMIDENIRTFFILFTFGSVFVNMVWGICNDLMMASNILRKVIFCAPLRPFNLFQYVVIPTRRSSALALFTLLTHGLEDGSAPYGMGLVARIRYNSLQDEKSLNPGKVKYNNINCTVCCNQSPAILVFF